MDWSFIMQREIRCFSGLAHIGARVTVQPIAAGLALGRGTGTARYILSVGSEMEEMNDLMEERCVGVRLQAIGHYCAERIGAMVVL